MSYTRRIFKQTDMGKISTEPKYKLESKYSACCIGERRVYDKCNFISRSPTICPCGEPKKFEFPKIWLKQGA